MDAQQRAKFEGYNRDLKSRGLQEATESQFLEMDVKFKFFIDNFAFIRIAMVSAQKNKTDMASSPSVILHLGGIAMKYQKQFNCGPLDFIKDYRMWEPAMVAMLEGRLPELCDEKLKDYPRKREIKQQQQQQTEKPKEPENPVLPKGFKFKPTK